MTVLYPLAELQISEEGSKTYIPKNFYRTGGSKTYIPKQFYTKTTYITLLGEKFWGPPRGVQIGFFFEKTVRFLTEPVFDEKTKTGFFFITGFSNLKQ
ncbi:hypothetical protein Hanom_Chr11g01004931 [Helianthus anomalus]